MSEEGQIEEERHPLEMTIRSLHERSVDAVLSNGREAVEAMLHPDFRTTGGDFQFESRDDFAKGVESGEYAYKNIVDRPQKVEFLAENLAIVTSQRTVEGTIRGTEVSNTFQNTAVYTTLDDEWKPILWAVTC
jgi:hypothetical protein